MKFVWHNLLLIKLSHILSHFLFTSIYMILIIPSFQSFSKTLHNIKVKKPIL